MELLLASRSPRRRELIAAMGLPFTAVDANIDETPPVGASPEEAAIDIARRKALAVSADPNTVVVAADTTVVLGNEVLGKPADAEDASRMLHSLSGTKHRVLTGVCVRRGEDVRALCVSTDVFFRRLTEAEIDAYVASGDPMDKAGAYGVQSLAAWFVERIEGDYSNVVGLPMEALGRLLTSVGYDVWTHRQA